MMKMKRLMASIVLLALLISLAACNGAGTGPASSGGGGAAASGEGKEPIIVGFLGWSSGPDALYGLVPQYLMEDYVAEINANGGWNGRQIDFRAYDISGTGGDFSEAVNATNKLLQEGAHAILGPSNSAQGTAVAELCNNAGVLHLPSSAAQLVTVAEDGNVRPYTFRCGPMNADLVSTLADYAYHQLERPRVAILYETTLVDCIAMRDAFKETYESLGGEIVAEATYQVEDIEFRAQLRSLAEAAPDYILMPAMAYKEVGNAAKQLSELGYADTIKMLGTSVYDVQDLLDIAGQELEGCIFATNGDVEDNRFAGLRQSWEENHSSSGMNLHMAGLVSFNAMKILEYAVLETDSLDSDVLREALESSKGFEMITGPAAGYERETHNLLGIEFTVKQFQGGRVESIGSYARQG